MVGFMAFVGGTLILGWYYSAILFLAPISCFDQVLEEDPNVNRLVRSRLQSSVFKRHCSPSCTPSLTSRRLFNRKTPSSSGNLSSRIHYWHAPTSFSSSTRSISSNPNLPRVSSLDIISYLMELGRMTMIMRLLVSNPARVEC